MLIFLRRTDWKDFTFKILDGWSFPPHRQYPLHSINQDFHPLHLHCCYLGKPALLQVVSPHLQKVCRKKTLLHYIKGFFFMCSASCLQLPPHQKGCSRKPLFTFRHTQKQTFKMIRVVWPDGWVLMVDAIISVKMLSAPVFTAETFAACHSLALFPKFPVYL